MRRTRRSGSTAGEALPLQLHIAGPQKGVGPFLRGRALAACAGHCHRPSLPPATRSAVLCLRTGGPSSRDRSPSGVRRAPPFFTRAEFGLTPLAPTARHPLGLRSGSANRECDLSRAASPQAMTDRVGAEVAVASPIPGPRSGRTAGSAWALQERRRPATEEPSDVGQVQV